MTTVRGLIERLVASGVDPVDAAEIVSAAVILGSHSAPKDQAAEKRRAYDRNRKRNSTGIPPESAGIPPVPPEFQPSRTSAQVVTPSLPSLRSEELKPISSDEDIRPLKAKCAKPNGFARFWEAYPNKTQKLKAEAAYAKALRRITGPDPPAVILAGVERAKASRQWLAGYIPHPTTWLNGGCWEDQPAAILPLQPRRDDGRQQQPPYDAKFEARQANHARAFAGADLAARQRREPG